MRRDPARKAEARRTFLWTLALPGGVYLAACLLILAGMMEVVYAR